MALIESKRQKLMKIKQMKGSRRQEKQNKQIQLAKQMMEQKLKKRMEQQGVFSDRAALSLCFIEQYLYHFKFGVPSGYVNLHIFGFWSNLFFLFCVCFDLFWRKGWWIRIFDVITEMAKRAAEFKIQKRAERQKMKETTRKIKEIRGSDTPEPPSTSTDWQSQMYCLPNNILSCDPNASGQISQKWPVVCFKCLP